MYLSQGLKGKNDLWRYLLGIFIVFMGYFVGQLPMYGVLFSRFSSNTDLGTDELNNFEQNLNFELLGIDKNVGLILLILMFVFAVIALYFVVTKLHYKKFMDLVTPNRMINYNKIAFGFILWLILSLAMEGVNYLMEPENYTIRWNGSGFIVLLLISITLLPIQTSFEELFFRGYIMQGLAFFTRNKWIAVLGASIFFGLVHGTNPEIEQYGFWTMQLYYIIAGLFLALITVLDDGLELALGVHAATNIAGATLFTYKGSVLQTDSLFITEEIKPWLMTLSFVVGSIIFIYICTKKYNWSNINSVMQSPIIAQDDMANNDDINSIN
ncbi:MAG TPA: CPBP family intramembrane metalloprotease [Saprospiraceae bacterium]|mgnify:FL=1|nr:CPBP family intramembrane metalloprotease [Saprospiraceae bacterium]MBK8827408.1 CPBP family intramembrane metalloprotease [Saprospiraceae bacterium]MBK9583265.1 CPBP family intramembrane metalloprotease [Saprospiraceae bacterium]HRG40444.1 CPBP family intramembrane metalloprotease [Saprospiraceae bacterium]